MLQAKADGNEREGLLIDFDHAVYQYNNDTEYTKWSASRHDYDDNDRRAPSRKRPRDSTDALRMAHASDDTESVERKPESGTVLEDNELAMEQTVSSVFLSFLWGY